MRRKKEIALTLGLKKQSVSFSMPFTGLFSRNVLTIQEKC